MKAIISAYDKKRVWNVRIMQSATEKNIWCKKIHHQIKKRIILKYDNSHTNTTMSYIKISNLTPCMGVKLSAPRDSKWDIIFPYGNETNGAHKTTVIC